MNPLLLYSVKLIDQMRFDLAIRVQQSQHVVCERRLLVLLD
jgi:hypothetical protein